MNARVLVTGGSGFIGSQVVQRFASDPEVARVVSVDITSGRGDTETVRCVQMDIRDGRLADVLVEEQIDRIVHLAAIVSPQPHHTREFLESVEVGGTRNLTAAALAAGVGHITVMSSGAAYGYHADNPDWIDESQPLRGNRDFAYADHKRRVEEHLAELRTDHPELVQLVLRPGTVLGPTVDNQITALWNWPVILGVSGSETPFVFIWVGDLVEIVARGCLHRRAGVYNVAGDGAVTLGRIADALGKRQVPVPASVIRFVLATLRRIGITSYGPEQVDFLRYRPVLPNRSLIEEFGYQPQKSSLEAFEAWVASRG